MNKIYVYQQKPYKSASARGLIDQTVDSVTSIDGPQLRSSRYPIARPGARTVASRNGQRRHYTHPLPLLLFFAMQSVTGAKIFSTPSRDHGSDIWGPVAKCLATSRLDPRGTTVDSYAPVCDQAVAVNAKSLIVVTGTVFALHFHTRSTMSSRSLKSADACSISTLRPSRATGSSDRCGFSHSRSTPRESLK